MDPNFTHFRFYNIDTGKALYSYSLPVGNAASHAELLLIKINQLAIEFKLPADSIGWLEIKHDDELFKRITPPRVTDSFNPNQVAE